MSGVLKPIYTTPESVKVRLANKIQFQSRVNEVLDGEMPNELLNQLIVDAETCVEQDLRSRYAIPFRSKSKGVFHALPDHSQRAIRIAVDLMSLILILSTDFGRGTHVGAEDYIENQQKLYDKHIDKLLGQDAHGKNAKIDRFKFSPPLDDLLLASSNREADDGIRGMVINTDGSHRDSSSYALDSINDPSEAFFRGGI